MNSNNTEDKQSVDVRSYYNAFSETYENRRHGGYHAFIDDLQASLVTLHVGGKDVLDVGCGTGLMLARIGPTAAKAVGVDLSPGMLKLAHAKQLQVQEGSATELPFDDNSFDVCYSFKTLSHVPELSRALSEMARVTRPGGHVFIELYNRRSIRYLARIVRGGAKITEEIGENQVFFRFYSIAEMASYLPENLDWQKSYGVRIFTVLPALLSWPLIGPCLKYLERTFADSFLNSFGGFYVLHCRKR